MSRPGELDAPPPATVRPHFGDTLIERVRTLGHPLCVGLDPHLGLLPKAFVRGDMQPGNPETAAAVETFCLAAVERLAGRVAVVKPQIGFFEPLGWRGIRTLERVVWRCRELGLLVLLDAKRGDIGSTAEGYAMAYLDPGARCAADAMTLNAYLGLDSLAPFVTRVEQSGAGMFVLVKTSNAGSGDLQDREIAGAPVYQEVAAMLSPLADQLRGPATGWSSLGVVVGATWPEQAEAVRERLPNAVFLVPGYGAQGGSASAAVRGFVPGPNGLEGGVVSSSRGILFPDAGAEDVTSWEKAFDAALDAATHELGDAIAGG